MRLRRLRWLGAVALVFAWSGVADAGPKDPIVGEAFERLVAAQDVEAQRVLELLFPDSIGYVVTGPREFLEPHRSVPFLPHTLRPYSVSVVCPDPASLEHAIRRVDSAPVTQHSSPYVRFAMMPLDGRTVWLRLITINQLRLDQWLEAPANGGCDSVDQEDLNDYLQYKDAVQSYLNAIDRGEFDAPEPKAIDFGLPETCDLYAPRPDYVIEGYQNYKDYLHAHESISADFGRGIVAFVPSDSLLEALKANAPDVAYPNKEAALLQYEYRKFFARGGDVRSMQTLTAAALDTLATGEYFFAVGLSGKIRFGRELLREEVERIEQETGRKVPRANHAFLFPGEPVLTAGAFFVERDESADGSFHSRIVEVNAHSGHFFYSNVTATVREDIAVRSNEYLLTLGHFFRALDSLGIAVERILIGKM